MQVAGGPFGPEEWSVRVARVGGVRVICAGELDLSCEGSLRQTLDAVLTEAEGRVVVDLSEVTFMDCAALNVLVSTGERVGSGSVLLLHPSRAVQRLLSLTGSAGLFGPA